MQKSLCENAMRSGVPQYIEVACANNTNAAWYTDRDNSMSDAEPEIQKAMAIVLGGLGAVLQGIQVCPGVYLTTAHGALKNPHEVKTGSTNPGRYGTRVVAYPMKVENMMQARKDESFISPRLRNPDLWKRSHPDFHGSDYVFIRVDKPLRPNNFVRPLEASFEDLKEQEVHLYRGKSRYKRQGEQGLNFSEEEAIPRQPEKLVTLYQSPQRVNQACTLTGQGTYLIYHNCPTEKFTSGSLYIVKNEVKPYVVGMTTNGIPANLKAETVGGSTMLKSSQFCRDYEEACGQPCGKIAAKVGP